MPRKPIYGPGHEYSPGEADDKDEMEDYMGYEEEAADVEEDLGEDREVVRHVEKPLGTGENVYVYLKTNPTTYEVIDQPFSSKIEARKFAEENYPGYKTKILYESEAIEEAQKLEQRKEKVQEVKKAIKKGASTAARETVAGLKKAGREFKEEAKATVAAAKPKIKKYSKAFLEASEDVAESHRFTRRHMEPKIKKAWGVPATPQRGYDINSIVASDGIPVSEPILSPDRRSSWTLVEHDGKLYTVFRSGTPSQPIAQVYSGRHTYDENAKRYQRAAERRPQPAFGFQPPQQQRPRFNFQPQPQQQRPRMNFPQQQPRPLHFGQPQRKYKINIPQQPRRQFNLPTPQGPRHKATFNPDKTDEMTYRRFNPQSPFKPMHFNFDTRLHTPYVPGRHHPLQREPYEEVEERKTTKRYHKKSKGGRKSGKR